VYLNRPQAAVLDIYDVERIEMLRGPQGTLYGRNTIGGAVKYVTKRMQRQFVAGDARNLWHL
jgi:iron complex outermembrane receptor protein